MRELSFLHHSFGAESQKKKQRTSSIPNASSRIILGQIEPIIQWELRQTRFQFILKWGKSPFVATDCTELDIPTAWGKKQFCINGIRGKSVEKKIRE